MLPSIALTSSAVPGGHGQPPLLTSRDMRTRIAGLGLAVLLLVGCQSAEAKGADAADFVGAYLRATSGGDEMRGWSFLDSDIQSAMFHDDPEAYVAAVRASDWTDLAWDVVGTTPEDGFVLVHLRLNAGDYPAVLTEPRGNYTLASGDGARRSFGVRFGLFGARTLFAAGG